MQVPKFEFGFEFGQRKTVGISVGVEIEKLKLFL